MILVELDTIGGRRTAPVEDLIAFYFRRRGESRAFIKTAIDFYGALNKRGSLTPDDIAEFLDWSKNPKLVMN